VTGTFGKEYVKLLTSTLHLVLSGKSVHLYLGKESPGMFFDLITSQGADELVGQSAPLV